MISVEKALEQLFELVEPLESEAVALRWMDMRSIRAIIRWVALLR
jgi:hypothetical protein